MAEIRRYCYVIHPSIEMYKINYSIIIITWRIHSTTSLDYAHYSTEWQNRCMYVNFHSLWNQKSNDQKQ